MWHTLPLAAALALTPAQPAGQPPAGLSLTNVRTTYGELGGARPDTPLLPGDVLFVGFDIDGLPVAPDGNVAYTMQMEVFDKDAKAIYKQEPVNKVDFVPLGGAKLPARAYVSVGPDQPAGEYTMRLTVTDPGTKATKSFDKKFTVLPKDFGLVAVYTSADNQGQLPAPTTGIVGQSVFVQFGVVGFGRDPQKKQPNVAIEMTPLDEAGKPLLQKPNLFNLDNGVDEKEQGFNVRFLFPMTRAGKFVVRLKATDKLTGKTNTVDLPLTVLPAAN